MNLKIGDSVKVKPIEYFANGGNRYGIGLDILCDSYCDKIFTINDIIHEVIELEGDSFEFSWHFLKH